MRKRLLFIIIAILSFATVQVQAQSVTDDLLGRINGLRAELGLSPYRLSSPLSVAANSHAQWMVNTSQVTHVQDNGSTPRSRANANGYNSQWVSENIYMGGLANVDAAWNFWINSSIHYAGLTSPNYQDIGIGTAQGDGGQAYVLVFGVPPGSTWGGQAANTGNSGNTSNSQAAAAAPLPIVGYDEVGNIQYELQAGDTPGQVLLLFGYTWDDLDDWLALNDLTEADIRSLSVGQVVLVAPPQGTYTPTPEIEETAEVTEAVSESTEEAIAPAEANVEVTVTATATLLDTQPDGIIPTQESTEALPTTEAPIEAVGQPVTFVAITPSPTITETASPVPTLQVNLPVSTAIAQTDIPETQIIEEANPGNSSRPPLWLIGAIVFQIGVLVFASVQFFMRSRG